MAISVFDPLRWRTVALTKGCLVSAVRASCAFPGLFRPVRHQRRFWIDGGIGDPPGLVGMKPGRVLYHHLPSTRVWGKVSRKQSRVPRRAEMAIIESAGLPKVGPFSLAQGAVAMGRAQVATQRYLARTLPSSGLD